MSPWGRDFLEVWGLDLRDTYPAFRLGFDHGMGHMCRRIMIHNYLERIIRMSL